MEKREFNEETTLKEILDSFMSSYTERDGSVEFSDWLENKLRMEIPDLSEEAGKKLAGEIIEAVANYDKNLSELNEAMQKGKSKEQWFADRIEKNYADMPIKDVDGKLSLIKKDIEAENQQLMQEICEVPTEAEIIETDNEFSGEVNKLSVKNKAKEIGKQVVMNGMAVAANIVKERLQSDDSVDVGNVLEKTFQNGLIEDSSEVKAVVAGAVKTAAEKGLENIVPEDATVDVIGNVAGVAVEGAEALCDVAVGKSNMCDAGERVCKAVVAAGGHFVSGVIKGTLGKIPIVGGIITDMAGGLLDHLHAPKFVNDVYNVIRNTAVATWEGVKQSCVGKAFARLKNKVFG